MGSPFRQFVENMGSYAPKSYPAASMAPRKDFVPYNKKDGYNYNRQSNLDNRLASAPTPNSPPSLPWELNHIVDDLSDSFIYLETAIQKISNCAKTSQTISKAQRTHLLQLYKAAKKAAEVIKTVGMHVEDVANMAGQPTPDLFVPKERSTALKRN